MRRLPIWITTGLLTIWVADAAAQAAPAIAAFSAAAGTQPPPPWRAVGLPGNKSPLSLMDITEADGARVLRLQASESYGALVHELAPWRPPEGAALQWRWRLQQALAKPDLHRKEGDDAAIKVCVMFDMPLDGLPFFERNLLRLARVFSGELLPAATICYVWDVTLARDVTLPNPYSKRLRYLVAEGADSTPGAWRSQKRPVHADFLRLFGHESAVVPPIIAVVVGADADNTGGRSLAYLADLAFSN